MSDHTVYDVPGGYRFVFPHERVQFVLRRFADDRRSMSTSCEVTVGSIDGQTGGHLHQARLNLTSTVGRRELQKALAVADDGTRWPDIIETICVKALALYRQGEPAQVVGNRPATGVQYRLWPLVTEGMSTIIFGEGGTGKSFLALLSALMVQSGRSALGWRPIQGNVLYLDYETSDTEVNDRIQAMCRGMQWPEIPIGYRYCYQPLADDIETVQEMIGDLAIDFLVVDSLGMACGGDPSDQALALRMMQALRSTKRPALLVDHVAKNQNADGKTSSPFGSVYKTNLARSVWMLKQGGRDGQETRIGLYHKKVNSGPLRRPCGLALRFHNDEHEQLQELVWRTFDVAASDDEDLVLALSLGDRILNALNNGAKSPAELARDLDAKEGSIRKSLARLGGRVARLTDGRWGKREQVSDGDITMKVATALDVSRDTSRDN